MKKCVVIGFVFSFLITLSLSAEEAQRVRKTFAKIVCKEGYLVNVGEERALRCEIIRPFYRYLGDIGQEEKIDVRDINVRFTVQYLTPSGLGEYTKMQEEFIPVYEEKGPDIGLVINCLLQDEILTVNVVSSRNIGSVFIEIPQDIPIKISEDRERYILSSVGVSGQNLQSGRVVKFKLLLLKDEPVYRVPILISYAYKGAYYEKLVFYSFRKEDFSDAAGASGLYHRQKTGTAQDGAQY